MSDPRHEEAQSKARKVCAVIDHVFRNELARPGEKRLFLNAIFKAAYCLREENRQVTGINTSHRDKSLEQIDGVRRSAMKITQAEDGVSQLRHTKSNAILYANRDRDKVCKRGRILWCGLSKGERKKFVKAETTIDALEALERVWIKDEHERLQESAGRDSVPVPDADGPAEEGIKERANPG